MKNGLTRHTIAGIPGDHTANPSGRRAAAGVRTAAGRPVPGSQSPQGNQALEVVPSQNNRILELPPLVDGALPPPPQPLINPEIPSPFIGCWEGTVERWDSAVGNFQNVTISKPGRIVFCYRPNHIDVPVAELEAEFAAPAWDQRHRHASRLSSRTLSKWTRNDISNRIYAITPSQIVRAHFCAAQHHRPLEVGTSCLKTCGIG